MSARGRAGASGRVVLAGPVGAVATSDEVARPARKVSACRDGEPGSAAQAISVWPGSPVSASQVRTDRHVMDLGQMRLMSRTVMPFA